MVDAVLILETDTRELTVRDEMGPVPPEPVPGSAPLIVDTVSVDRVRTDAVIVLPVRVDKLRAVALTLAKFAEYRVK
jgi:hypothetical protein